MELSKSSYIDVVRMPVDEVKSYIKWKTKYDRDRYEVQQKSIQSMK